MNTKETKLRDFGYAECQNNQPQWTMFLLKDTIKAVQILRKTFGTRKFHLLHHQI